MGTDLAKCQDQQDASGRIVLRRATVRRLSLPRSAFAISWKLGVAGEGRACCVGVGLAEHPVKHPLQTVSVQKRIKDVHVVHVAL